MRRITLIRKIVTNRSQKEQFFVYSSSSLYSVCFVSLYMKLVFIIISPTLRVEWIIHQRWCGHWGFCPTGSVVVVCDNWPGVDREGYQGWFSLVVISKGVSIQVSCLRDN